MPFGALVGNNVSIGPSVGNTDGNDVGSDVGSIVGSIIGDSVGIGPLAFVGSSVGIGVIGVADGAMTGMMEGIDVGISELAIGVLVGSSVGLSDSSVGAGDEVTTTGGAVGLAVGLILGVLGAKGVGALVPPLPMAGQNSSNASSTSLQIANPNSSPSSTVTPPTSQLFVYLHTNLACNCSPNKSSPVMKINAVVGTKSN